MTDKAEADLAEAVRLLREAKDALGNAARAAGDALREWDADNDMRVGKILKALYGKSGGYREDIDLIHQTEVNLGRFLARPDVAAVGREGERCGAAIGSAPGCGEGRIYTCGLAKGHDGDHESAEYGPGTVSWAPALAREEGPGEKALVVCDNPKHRVECPYCMDRLTRLLPARPQDAPADRVTCSKCGGSGLIPVDNEGDDGECAVEGPCPPPCDEGLVPDAPAAFGVIVSQDVPGKPSDPDDYFGANAPAEKPSEPQGIVHGFTVDDTCKRTTCCEMLLTALPQRDYISVIPRNVTCRPPAPAEPVKP